VGLASLPGTRSSLLGLLCAASGVVVPGIGVRVTIRGLLIHTSLGGVAGLGARRFGFTLHAGPLESAPFAPGSFDLVYAGQVLEHLPDPGFEVALLGRLLAPGGLLCVVVPNYGSLSIRLGCDDFHANRPPGHLNYFSRAPLARLVASHGLGVLRVRTTGLAYRALLGLPPRGAGAPPVPPGRAPASEALPGAPGTGAVLKLRALGLLDLLLSVPGWGMQLEVVARRPATARCGSRFSARASG